MASIRDSRPDPLWKRTAGNLAGVGPQVNRSCCAVGPPTLGVVARVPLLDLELARRITEGIAYLLSRWAPDAQPWPEDRSAPEFAEKLRRRDPREIIYLREAIEPCWPHFRSDDDPNRERVFVRVAVKGERVEFASAVFTGSLVHWEAASADVYGELTWLAMDPDQHLAMRLEAAETLLREMGLTLIPPAAMSLTFGKWSLAVLLDPRMQNLREAGEDVG